VRRRGVRERDGVQDGDDTNDRPAAPNSPLLTRCGITC